jgi:hypothetical protein
MLSREQIVRRQTEKESLEKAMASIQGTVHGIKADLGRREGAEALIARVTEPDIHLFFSVSHHSSTLVDPRPAYTPRGLTAMFRTAAPKTIPNRSGAK